MTKKYTPAIFQPTLRPSWGGVMSYISAEEKAKILEAIINYPKDTHIVSKFWEETIKPDLDMQYGSFVNTCLARGRGAKTYWETKVKDKGNLSLPYNILKDNSLKNKDKDKDKNKEQDENKNENEIYNEEFEEFWKVYTPVKCNGRFVDKGSKKTAYEKYVKLLKKGESHENIIRGVREYINRCQANNQLTCGATVFLNQERWKCCNEETVDGNPSKEYGQPRSILETYTEIARDYQQADNLY